MKIYLDDIRTPKDEGWIIVRSYDEFVSYIEKHGLPDFISFDHDLGYSMIEDEKTGYDAAKWLVEYYLDNGIKMPINFNVHSANPIGAENIRKYINNFNSNESRYN